MLEFIDDACLLEDRELDRLRRIRDLLPFVLRREYQGFPEYIQEYSKNELPSEHTMLSEYDVVLYYKSNGNGYSRYKPIFHDARYNFILRHSKKPIACLGFDIETGKAIKIKQIQGVRGRREELKPIKWERMLLKIATDWAVKHHFEQVRLTTAEQSKWYGIPRAERMKMRYDVTARRSGFTLHETGGYYYLDIEN
jgi:hypothetical protein